MCTASTSPRIDVNERRRLLLLDICIVLGCAEYFFKLDFEKRSTTGCIVLGTIGSLHASQFLLDSVCAFINTREIFDDIGVFWLFLLARDQ